MTAEQKQIIKETNAFAKAFFADTPGWDEVRKQFEARFIRISNQKNDAKTQAERAQYPLLEILKSKQKKGVTKKYNNRRELLDVNFVFYSNAPYGILVRVGHYNKIAGNNFMQDKLDYFEVKKARVCNCCNTCTESNNK